VGAESTFDAGGPDPDRAAAAFLIRLRAMAAAAKQGERGVERISSLAELQRVGAFALRAAVAEARERGVPWRELAKALGVPVTTLHQQYRAGHGLTVPARDLDSALARLYK